MQKGLGVRPKLIRTILDQRPDLDLLEIVTENALSIGGRPKFNFESLREFYPIAIHGVSMSVGSLDAPRAQYLESLKELIQWLRPAYVSDHLCWTRQRGQNSHDLLPLPRTFEALRLVSERVSVVQDVLGQRFYLENPSAYVAFRDDEMSEVEFLNELSRKTGCGVLLDINNLIVNHKNLGVSPEAYIANLNSDVCYFHIAGHSTSDDPAPTRPVLIDTHDNHCLPEIWPLLARARAKWPKAATVLEWDGNVPPLDTLLHELAIAQAESSPPALPQDILQQQRSLNPPRAPARPLSLLFDRFWYSLQDPSGDLCEAPEVLEVLNSDLPVHSKRGLSIYNRAYFLRLRDVMSQALPTATQALQELDEDGFDALVTEYLQRHPPTEEGIQFAMAGLEQWVRSGSRLAPFADPKHPAFRAFVADSIRIELAQDLVFSAPNPPAIINWQAIEALRPEDWQLVGFKIWEHFAAIRTQAAQYSPDQNDTKKLSRSEQPRSYWIGRLPDVKHADFGRVATEEVPDSWNLFLAALREGVRFGQACYLMPGQQNEQILEGLRALQLLCALGAITAITDSRTYLIGQNPKTPHSNQSWPKSG